MTASQRPHFTTFKSPPSILLIALLLLAGAGIVLALEQLPFEALDWNVFRAALADPWRAYQYPGFFNPPWTIWILAPLTRLPYSTGLLRLLTLVVFALLVWKRGGDWRHLLLVFTSVPLLYQVANLNIEWIPALAFLVGQRGIGLALLLVKPQSGLLAALAWLRETPAASGASAVRAGWILLLPTLLLLAISFLLYGGWPLQVFENARSLNGSGVITMDWNASLFPWTVPLGLWWMFRAWKTADEFLGVSATLALSPYFGLYGLSLWFVLFVLRHRERPALGWLVWMVLWGAYVLRHLPGVWA